MNKFWNQTVEFKALIISLVVSVVGFLGTMVLFWFQRYDIPLAVLLAGVIVVSSWLILFLSKKKESSKIKLDIFAIYLRLGAVFLFTVLFAVLKLVWNIVIISPIYLVIAYLVISLSTLLAFYRKDK